MAFALKYIRYIICSLAVLAAICIYIGFTTSVPSTDLARVYIGRTYALTGFALLYAALLASPLYSVFPRLPLRVLYVRARRAIGVSAFFFGLLHASVEFFWLLGGISGLAFLGTKYIEGVLLGAAALAILTMMAATSFNWAVEKLGAKWKMLHRLVYLAGVLLVIHVLTLGSHFVDLSTFVPRLFMFGLFVLLVLEALRFEKYLSRRFPGFPRLGLMFAVYSATACVVLVLFRVMGGGGGGTGSLGVHAEHIKLAQLAQQGKLQGPKFSVRFKQQPANSVPGKQDEYEFTMWNDDTGEQVKNFDVVNDKLLHLVIVDNELKYFIHVHPVFSNGVFSIQLAFPKNDLYHLYFDFEPAGEIEQQYQLTVATGSDRPAAKFTPNTDFTTQAGGYVVKLATQDTFRAKDMSVGQQPMTFGVYNSDGSPVTTLKPYLAAYGHLVLINQETYDYIHVHPTQTDTSAGNSGPSVEFLPLGLNGPIKPGIYRVFAQFNPNDTLITVDFTISIE